MASRILALPPEQAFRLVATLRAHGRWVPLTRVSAPTGLAQPGDEVVARTAVVLVDRMSVLEADPPRRLVLCKRGPVLVGTATITVAPVDTRSRVSWSYAAHLRGPLPARLTGPVLDRALDAMAALVLWRMARAVHRSRRP